ncbi:BppU family phage baseplate upper protein [Bacillus sp. ISL-57]|uniref:BppU family phage baseplate upper protein n=1 Tax=Bacillus sp. ISL-57 TaxID=2819135 RepID=UPI001BE90624|nr:BppU family phage baseplate upper protein [Bacillus sp. ISL-57]MBT2718321.1 BppU family phage baseplate upper protein [Bacillus sp. ISL-57]
MVNEIFKSAFIRANVAVTSNITKTSIRFTTQDNGTAKLVFNINKDNSPLPLGSAATAKIFLRMADGSAFEKDATIIDPVNGQVEYILVEEINHPGVVKGEMNVYFSNGQSMTVCQFQFTIEKTLKDRDIVPLADYYVKDFESLKGVVTDQAAETEQVLFNTKEQLERLTEETGANIAVQVDAAKKDTEGVTHNDLPSRLDAEFGKVTTQLADMVTENNTYSVKQERNLSSYSSKMNNNEPVVIVCQGDSLDNSQDTESADRRPYTADPTYVIGGSTDTTIGAYTYPEILQASLNESGKQVTVLKRGFNGDTAEKSYNRWSTNPNADLHIIQLGTNDTWVEQDVLVNLQNYYDLIKRIIDWGSAVVIFTPPRKNGYSKNQGTYVSVLKEMGKRLSIPVIDTTLFLDGYYANDVFQSDGVHLKGKGYYIMGAKAASVLTGITTIIDPYKIRNNRQLVIDPNYNHWSSRGSITFESNNQSPFGSGVTYGDGNVAIIGANSQINFGFYADEDDLLIIPQFRTTDGQCTIELNYRAETPYPVSSLVDGKVNKEGQSRPPFSLTYNYGQSQVLDYRYININDLNGCAFRLTSRGYNSIQVKNILTSGTVWLYGFTVINLSSYLIHRFIVANAASTGLTIGNSSLESMGLLAKTIFTQGLLLPDLSSGEKDIGAYHTKFQKMFLNGFVSTGAFSTANIPSYNDYQPGAMIYDTTLDKPIFRNAANNGFVDNLSKFVSVPTSATASGFPGEWSSDSNYLYVCHAKNTWKRSPISTW